MTTLGGAAAATIPSQPEGLIVVVSEDLPTSVFDHGLRLHHFDVLDDDSAIAPEEQQ